MPYMVNDLLYSDNVDGGKVSKFVAYDKDKAYTIVMKSHLSKEYFLNDIKKNKINRNMKGAKKLKKLTEESNPIIVYYEFN